MAAPTLIALLFNPTTNVLHLEFDEAVTFAGAARDITITNQDLVVFANASAAFASGSETTTPTIQLTETPSITAGDGMTFAFASGAIEGLTDPIGDISGSFEYTLDREPPLSRDDLTRWHSALVTKADFSAEYGEIETNDFAAFRDRLLDATGLLSAAPLALLKAREAVTAYDKFCLSSMDAAAHAELLAAMRELRRTLPQDPNTFGPSGAGT